MIRRLLSRLFRDDQGQDLTEYTLLIAMVALVAFGIFASTGQNAAGVWDSAGTTLTSAASAASGSSTAPSGGGGEGGGDGDHDHHH
jgi:Flp pilus assembly pilin Flp